MRLLSTTFVCLLLSGASVAEAADRFAAPNGKGTECTEEKPCSLVEALTFAFDGAEVVITPGDYVLGTNTRVISKDVRVHGEFGAPMPRISASLPEYPAIELEGDGARLSHIDLTVNNITTGIACGTDSVIDGVRITALDRFSIGIAQRDNCFVRDSLLRTDGRETIGLYSTGSQEGVGGFARNVTALAAGENSVAVGVAYTGLLTGTHELNAKNVIASGEAFDLRTFGDLGGGGIISISNSNFDSADVGNPELSITGGGNQSAPPIFVDAAGGDYRQAPGSPTIDAGAVDLIGPADLDGNPRVMGPAPDIGAFEFVPPPPGAAGILTALSVTPKAFRPRRGGTAIVSRTAAKGKAGGATVRYALSAAASVSFTVERALRGRRVGGLCRKQTEANRGRKRCTRFRSLRGGFGHQGAVGENKFGFSGRIGARALAPGKYRLVGRAGASVRRAVFRISR